MKKRAVLWRVGSPIVLAVLVLIVPSLAATGACEHIVVAGAGVGTCNGVYTYSGTAYGHPVYVNGSGTLRIAWMGSWYLSDFFGETYYSNASSANEPPSAGWVSTGPAYAPAPTLSCGDTFTLTYTAGEHGRIRGTSPQTVVSGGDGTQVTAVPDAGFRFASWSDGVFTSSRTDTNVTADLAVTFSVERVLVFVPAFPATATEEWSFLTRPLPTPPDGQGYVGPLPIVYTVGETLDVRFGLVDSRGKPITDADVMLRLYQLDASGGGPLFASFGASYDRRVDAYVTAIPTISPELTLPPGLYEFRLMVEGDEGMQRLWVRLQ